MENYSGLVFSGRSHFYNMAYYSNSFTYLPVDCFGIIQHYLVAKISHIFCHYFEKIYNIYRGTYGDFNSNQTNRKRL